MRLHHLRKFHSLGHGGDHTSSNYPRGKLLGFLAALDRIGISKSTAYRWMTGAENVAEEVLGLDPKAFPEPDSEEWGMLETAITEHVRGLSLRRLVIGGSENGSEDQRQEELISRSETGDSEALKALERIASGELTLVQAIRAASGALATKGKERTDPVYLKFDTKKEALTGLFVKSLTTLENAFSRWNTLPLAERRAGRDAWLELNEKIPENFDDV
jgi:hypothetical protein